MTPTKTIKLYKHTVIIDFYEQSHRYIERITGERPLSVTGATGIVDKSRPLIFWAVGLMRDFLTETLNSGKAITTDHILEAANQHTIKKEQAATKGSEVHDWIEQYITAKLKKTDKPEKPQDEQVLNGILAFLNWEREHQVKFLATEKIVYSKKYNFVGLMDCKAMIDGKISVVDFKTSNGIYSEYRYQVAGYRGADEEETGQKYDGNNWLIRFDKNTAEFEAHELKDHKKDYQAFLAALTLKKRERELSKAA
jgi:hypothetical protein